MKKRVDRTLVTLEGILDRITYFNEENHYTVAKLNTLPDNHIVTILGYMAAVQPGETLKVSGRWETHPKYGQQLKIESYTVLLPATTDGIKKYLQSGIIKGVGPRMAQRLIAGFGEKTIEVIETSPERLCEIEGIGETRAEQIHQAWKSHHLVRDLMQFLQSVGIKPSFSAKIIQTYGWQAQQIIRKTPYRLAHDIPGITFYIADTVARKLGLPMSGPERARAGLLHLLQQSLNEGHTHTGRSRLVQECADLFQIEAGLVAQELAYLEESGELVCEPVSAGAKEAVFLAAVHQAELGLANRLKAMLSIPVGTAAIDTQQITAAVMQQLAIKLSVDQQNALKGILSHRIVIITGGPGTGKTTLIRSARALLEAQGRQVILAAPTGRAAKRLAEVTRRTAKTIHRLLGYSLQEGVFEKNPDNPLDADVIIIDEASMVDTILMYHLLRAIPIKAFLILVGDIFQLPPVGPGNALAEMIHSQKIPVFYLNEIFRQAEESPIVLNAHRIRQGLLPELIPPETGDLSEFYFIEQADPARVAETIVDLCQNAIPKHFSLDPLNDVQVLTPMHKGHAGTINLNQVLQAALNPSAERIEIFGRDFKHGDKVMHLKNNYQKDVYNGDIGRISGFDKKNSQVLVDFDGRTVTYESTEIDEISLAYAISVHKSQGSEYPAVIVPLMTQHYALLQRNLLYTAITRGEKLVVLIGSRRALEIALQNDRPRHRRSSLAHRLCFD